MPRMSDVRSVAANSVVDNVLSGKLHEFLGEDSAITLLAAASAVGARVTLLIGGESVIQDQEIGAANRFPIYPDDFVAEGAGFQADRLLLSIRNTTGGAITVQTVVDTSAI